MVNAIRARQNGAVRILSVTRKRLDAKAGPAVSDRAIPESEVRQLKRGPEQKRLPDDVEVSVFVLLDRQAAKEPRLVTRRSGRIGSAKISLSDLEELERDPNVESIELAQTLRAPNPTVGATAPHTPSADRYAAINAGTITRRGRERPIGENVLVGIIDVGGLDFAHEDFLDDKGASRIIGIWDQGGDAFPPPKSVPGARGSEITRAHIAFALREAKAAKVSPHDLAPQSQQIRGSHATHVASIAAGRSGVCKRARIAAVMVSLPHGDMERSKSFYDTSAIADGLDYLFKLAGDDPSIDAISINVSLGTNGGPHDGSELMSRWIDMAMTEPGRAITVAAGNSGQEAPQFEGDLGFWSGRVHSSGRIPAADLRRDLEWVVVGDGLRDISENELEIWYSAQDEFHVEVFNPDGESIATVAPGQRIENLVLKDRTVLSVYNVLCDPKNGANRISVYLSPFMRDPVVGVGAGTWKIRLTGKVVRDGAYNAWIERDDPAPGSIKTHWRLPSFFGPATFVDSSTVSSLACGPRVTGVANLDEARELVNVSSSQGPTRDGRKKPDIAAPGTRIVAASGFDPEKKWVEMTGTSMSSPFVAGVSALMLSIYPKMTAAQVGGVIQRTSKPLPGTSYEWENKAGFGVIDPPACLKAVERLQQPVEDLTDRLQDTIKGTSR